MGNPEKLKASNREEAMECVLTLLRARAVGATEGECAFPVMIVPDFARVREAFELAARTCPTAGVEILTPADYLEDRWALYGDGRGFVSAAERSVGCLAALNAVSDGSVSMGMFNLARRVAVEALGSVATAYADPGFAEGLSREERMLADALMRYRGDLAERGLIEPSEAWEILLSETLPPQEIIVLVECDGGVLSAVQRRYFEARRASEVSNGRTVARPARRAAELDALLARLFRGGNDAPLKPGGALRFAFAAGVEAEPRLIFDCAREAIEAADGSTSSAEGFIDVAVAAIDPALMWRRLNRRAIEAGMAVTLESALPIADVPVGRLLLQWCELCDDASPFDIRLLCDAALNRAASMDAHDAFSLERELRGDRLLDRASALEAYGARLSGLHADAFVSWCAGRYGEAAGLLQRAAHLAEGPQDEKARSMAVLESLKELSAAFEGRSLAVSDLAKILLSVTVSADAIHLPFSEEDGRKAKGRLRIMDLSGASRLAPGEVECLIVAGLSASERPVKDAEDACRSFLRKVGAASSVDPLERMRTVYHDALEAARSTVVLERALYGPKADPRYPATLLQETVDCYRADPTATDDLAPIWEIPESALPFMSTLPETELVYGAGGVAKPDVSFTDEIPRTGAISPECRRFIVLPRSPESAGLPGLDLSPSQIESYLGCPYNWFVNRRLRLDTPDEGFGVMERGTFVHRILQLTFAKLRELGIGRITADSLEKAVEVLRETFAETCVHEATARPGNRYAPVNAWEEESRRALLEPLEDFLASQCSFLPGFRPLYEEWAYGTANQSHYGPHRLVGTVDRIDVDDKGRAVVIDYKTGNLADYNLRAKGATEGNSVLPHRMQALIYARIVEEELGVQVVGAVYVNPLDRSVAGAYDARALGPESLPGIDPETAAVGPGYGPAGIDSFAELLRLTEEEVCERLKGLERGEIEPDPLDPSVCEYCPATMCERRLR